MRYHCTLKLNLSYVLWSPKFSPFLHLQQKQRTVLLGSKDSDNHQGTPEIRFMRLRLPLRVEIPYFLIMDTEMFVIKVAQAWRETTPVCSRLTRLVRAGYSHYDSGASRERARITRRAQDGSIHMQLVLRPAPITARSTLSTCRENHNSVVEVFFVTSRGGGGGGATFQAWSHENNSLTSSTHSFAYSYRLVKKCLWKFAKLQSVITSLFFNRIRFSLLYLKNFTLSSKLKLNLLWSSSLSTCRENHNSVVFFRGGGGGYFSSLISWK